MSYVFYSENALEIGQNRAKLCHPAREYYYYYPPYDNAPTKLYWLI